MEGTRFCANRSEFAQSAFSNVAANFLPVSISDCKQAIDMGYKPKSRQCLLIKYIQEIEKPLTDLLYPSAWSVGVGNDRSIADCISGCRKAINIGQKLAAKKKTLGLKHTTTNLFPQNCTLPESYIFISSS